MSAARTSSGVLGFDTLSFLSPERARAFHACGFRFALRYVRLVTGIDETPGKSLTSAEPGQILGAGLALMPVQRSRANLMPSAAEGIRTGRAMWENCRALGFPKGVTCWYNGEDLHEDARDADAIAHVNAWAREVRSAGYGAGLYVGPGLRLSAEQLFRDLTVDHYWKSAAWVPTVERRGYQMWQGRRRDLEYRDADGNRRTVPYDPDMCGVDARSGRPVWWAPEGHNVP